MGGWAQLFVMKVAEGSKSTLVCFNDDGKSVNVGKRAKTIGACTVSFNDVEVKDLKVSASNVLGAEGEGETLLNEALKQIHLSLSAAMIGATKRAAQIMHRYASRRKMATGNLLANGLSSYIFSQMILSIEAGFQLVKKLATLMDEGVTIPEEVIAACKVLCSDTLLWASDRFVQMLGGRGYEDTNLGTQMYRDACMFKKLEIDNKTLCNKVVSGVKEIVSFFKDQPDASKLEEYISGPYDEVAKTHIVAWFMAEMSFKGAKGLSETAKQSEKFCHTMWTHAKENGGLPQLFTCYISSHHMSQQPLGEITDLNKEHIEKIIGHWDMMALPEKK
jgi:hypothetical protein